MGKLTKHDDLPVGSWTPTTAPKGWEPGYELGGDSGSITIQADGEPEDWDQILTELGRDVAHWVVVGGTVQVRAWDAAIGKGEVKRLHYYRAQIAPRSHFVRAEMFDVLRRAQRRTPAKRHTVSADVAQVECLADWQLGKAGEDGGGTPETVDRIQTCADLALDRARKVKPSRVVLAGLGDILEGCSGWYDGQAFTIDMDERQQFHVATELMMSIIDRFAGYDVLVTGCTSNHGEKRPVATGALDSRDLQLLDQVARICAHSERYSHVQFAGPDATDPHVTKFEAAGVRVATTHGHVGFKGGNAAGAAEGWLLGQIRGQAPAADAEILISGHRHHLAVAEWGRRRTWFQCPANDGGSRWFRSRTGFQSPAGQLSLLVGDACGPRGWSDLVVHQP
jgi:hypothetical protein